MADDTTVFKIVAGVVGVGVLLLIIILPMSFSSLEYYEYGFARQKSTGKVDLSEVYSVGKHFLGPDYEFKIFPSDSHNVHIRRAAAFTQDKLEVKISASFQYFLRKSDLALLHQAYDLYYKDVMETSAVDAVKGAMTVFNTREAFKNRSQVEDVLFKAVRERLGGICCPFNCSDDPQDINKCPEGCKKGVCGDKDKGLFVDVKYFQLGPVEIPDEVENRFLQQLTLTEEALREKLLQNAQVIRKETEAEVRRIKNEGQEISQNAESKSQLIRSMSQANYTSIIESARSQGLKKLYSDLGITSQEHKNSFDYLRTLRGLDNAHLTVDFQQKIAGSL